MTGTVLGLTNAVWALLLLIGVGRLLRHYLTVRLPLLAALVGLGVLLSAACGFAEQHLFAWTGVTLDPAAQGTSIALSAMLLFAAPLEEGVKLFAVWPLHARRVVATRVDSVLTALALGTGFALYEGTLLASTSTQGLLGLRVLLASLAHLFFAGTWAYVLGSEDAKRWLRWTWAAAAVFHGLFDHIVLVRGDGTLAAAAPVVAAMLGLSWIAVRWLRRSPKLDEWLEGDSIVPAPVSQRSPRPHSKLMVRWIVMGAFVTTGVVLTALVIAVYAGHQMGLDFAAANESDVRANGPLVLLGASVTAAFPVAGFLIARASAAPSVLEPAMGTALAIVAVVAVLSLAAPIALVFVLAVAPVAFGLACAGAWFGIER